MQTLMRTLLLIALCVQLPFASFAAFAASPSEHQHDSHHHSAVLDEAGLHHHASPASQQDQTGAADDCATAHHCTSPHFQAINGSHVHIHASPLVQAFSLNSEKLASTGLLPSIERPKWASI